MAPFPTPIIPNLDVVASFEALASKPGAFLLLSDDASCASPSSPASRWSFFGFHPKAVLQMRNQDVFLYEDLETSLLSPKKLTGKPLEVLDSLFSRYDLWNQTTAAEGPPQRMAVGFFGYEFGQWTITAPRGHANPFKSAPPNSFPDLWFGFYDNIFAYDHEEQRLYLPKNAAMRQAFVPLPKLLSKTPFSHSKSSGSTKPWLSSLNRENYCRAVEKILRYIGDGDLYQANLAQRFKIPWNTKRNPYDLFRSLSHTNAAPFSAFLRLEKNRFLLSCSPERFLRVEGRKILSQPVKGTLPRGQTPEEDHRNRHLLLRSEKNRAELTMIVDLHRNDLGRICEPGSVRVPSLAELQSFASVHHLVGNVEGILKPEITPVDILHATFPSGSISGAPKIRALEIINELEPVRRDAFSGCIGYVGNGKQLDWNIAIRTLMIDGDQALLHAGAGIVAESDPLAEYNETLVKVAPILAAMENLKTPHRGSRYPMDISRDPTKGINL